MIINMKKLLLVISLFLSISLGGFALSPVATAQFKEQACEGISTISPGTDCEKGSGDRISTLLKNVLNIFSLVVGIIAVITLVIGGLKFITSQGEPGSTASARNTIIYSIVGLVVVAFAQVIVRFVLFKAAP